MTMCYISSMNHIFLFGRMPALSAAELLTALRMRYGELPAVRYAPQWILADIPEQDVRVLQRQLAGTVKTGQIVAEGKSLEKLLSPELLFTNVETEPRMEFAFSGYPEEKGFARQLHGMGLKQKRALAKEGYKVRFVTAKTGALSSAAVVKNHLLDGGTEFLIFKHTAGFMVAVTKAVQDYEGFASRDRARKGLDAKSGMLPPQLARLMVNLAGKKSGSVILDPFCGSGTVLTEARDSGMHVIGSDNSAKAIHDAEQNLQAQESRMTWRLLHVDVAVLTKNFPVTVDAIITEPFLGPPQRRALGSRAQEHFFKKLRPLYRRAFRTFASVLRDDGCVICILPAVQAGGNVALYPFLDELLLENGFRIIQPLPREAVAVYRPMLSKRNSLLYARPRQYIAREILLLEKGGARVSHS